MGHIRTYTQKHRRQIEIENEDEINFVVNSSTCCCCFFFSFVAVSLKFEYHFILCAKMNAFSSQLLTNLETATVCTHTLALLYSTSERAKEPQGSNNNNDI